MGVDDCGISARCRAGNQAAGSILAAFCRGRARRDRSRPGLGRSPRRLQARGGGVYNTGLAGWDGCVRSSESESAVLVFVPSPLCGRGLLGGSTQRMGEGDHTKNLSVAPPHPTVLVERLELPSRRLCRPTEGRGPNNKHRITTKGGTTNGKHPWH